MDSLSLEQKKGKKKGRKNIKERGSASIVNSTDHAAIAWYTTWVTSHRIDTSNKQVKEKNIYDKLMLFVNEDSKFKVILQYYTRAVNDI